MRILVLSSPPKSGGVYFSCISSYRVGGDCHTREDEIPLGRN